MRESDTIRPFFSHMVVKAKSQESDRPGANLILPLARVRMYNSILKEIIVLHKLVNATVMFDL